MIDNYEYVNYAFSNIESKCRKYFTEFCFEKLIVTHRLPLASFTTL